MGSIGGADNGVGGVNNQVMYLRFITQFINEENKRETGLFNALEFVQYHELTTDEYEVTLKELYTWFKQNLDAPGWFAKPQGRWHENKARSWFKDSAKEHIQKVQEIIEILEKYNIVVERITSKTAPGHIVFQDEFQISAVPNSKTLIKKTV